MLLETFFAGFTFSLIFLMLGFDKQRYFLLIVGSISMLVTSVLILTTGIQVAHVATVYNSNTGTTETVTKIVDVAPESATALGWLLSLTSLSFLLFSGYYAFYKKW